MKFSKTQKPKSPKIAVVDKPQCRLTPAPKGTPANIRMNLIFSETRLIDLQRGSIFIIFHAIISDIPVSYTHLTLPTKRIV